MTVPVQTLPKTHIGNDSATVFNAPIIPNEDSLSVYVLDSNSIRTVLSKTTHYTVTFNKGKNSTITLVSGDFDWQNSDGTLKTDYTLYVDLDIEIKQEYDIRNESSLQHERYEDLADYIVKVLQQQKEKINNCLKLPYTKKDFRIDSLIAGKFIKIKDDLSGFESALLADEDTFNTFQEGVGIDFVLNGNNVTINTDLNAGVGIVISSGNSPTISSNLIAGTNINFSDSGNQRTINFDEPSLVAGAYRGVTSGNKALTANTDKDLIVSTSDTLYPNNGITYSTTTGIGVVSSGNAGTYSIKGGSTLKYTANSSVIYINYKISFYFKASGGSWVSKKYKIIKGFVYTTLYSGAASITESITNELDINIPLEVGDSFKFVVQAIVNGTPALLEQEVSSDTSWVEWVRVGKES